MKIKRKSFLPIISILALVIVVGIIFFNKTIDDRVPSDGIYFINHRSYYAYGVEDEKTIYLDCYLVNSRKNEPDIFYSYSDFTLGDEAGVEYKITYSSADISNLLEPTAPKQSSGTIAHHEMSIKFNPTTSTNITTLSYKDEMGNLVKRNLGLIQIDILPQTREQLSTVSNRVFWQSSIQPTFTNAEFCFENTSKSPLTITEISYGSIGVLIHEGGVPITFAPSETVDKIIPVDLTEEVEGEPIVYYLKPKFLFIVDEEEHWGIMKNISREKFIDLSEDELREYLYLIDISD